MKIIYNEEIKRLAISPALCVDWVCEAFLMKAESQLPPKISLHVGKEDFINTMPCVLPERFHTYGCKVISRVVGQHPALKSNIMLVDTLTGEMTTLMDGDWITSMRTGAVAALAINTLRNSNARVYSFVGLGETGNATIDCLLATNPDIPMTIRLKRYKDHAEKTGHRLSAYDNVAVEVVESMDELVDGADVVVSCITVAEGLLMPRTELFKPGVLVVPVHTRGFQNCDTCFDKVFADDRGHVCNFKYFNEFRSFGELGDILAGKIKGRESDSERILAYNIGLGLHDIVFASKILRLLDQNWAQNC